MKNRMYRQMQICSCLGKRTSSSGCCCSMHILNSEKRIKVHIINIYNEMPLKYYMYYLQINNY